MKKTAALLTAVILMFCMLVPAFADEYDLKFSELIEDVQKPVIFMPEIKANVGDEIEVPMYLGNVFGLTNADLVIQYNPYMVEYEGYEVSSAANNAQIYMMATEEVGPNQVDENGIIAHEVRAAFFHVESFPMSADICKIATFKFKAIGGGDCKLEITASDFKFEEESEAEAPSIYNGKILIEGEEASSWDYSAITSGLVTVPTGTYQINTQKHISKGAKIAIAAVFVVIVVLVVVFIAKGNSYTDEDDDEEEQINGNELNVPENTPQAELSDRPNAESAEDEADDNEKEPSDGKREE